jgi:hypothetical protein
VKAISSLTVVVAALALAVSTPANAQVCIGGTCYGSNFGGLGYGGGGGIVSGYSYAPSYRLAPNYGYVRQPVQSYVPMQSYAPAYQLYEPYGTYGYGGGGYRGGFFGGGRWNRYGGDSFGGPGVKIKNKVKIKGLGCRGRHRGYGVELAAYEPEVLAYAPPVATPYFEGPVLQSTPQSVPSPQATVLEPIPPPKTMPPPPAKNPQATGQSQSAPPSKSSTTPPPPPAAPDGASKDKPKGETSRVDYLYEPTQYQRIRTPVHGVLVTPGVVVETVTR